MPASALSDVAVLVAVLGAGSGHTRQAPYHWAFDLCLTKCVHSCEQQALATRKGNSAYCWTEADLVQPHLLVVACVPWGRGALVTGLLECPCMWHITQLWVGDRSAHRCRWLPPTHSSFGPGVREHVAANHALDTMVGALSSHVD